VAGDNWDRVPIDAQSIDAPLSSSAIFLVVTVGGGPAPLATMCLVLGGRDDLAPTFQSTRPEWHAPWIQDLLATCGVPSGTSFSYGA
jgi:hypothetical protein